MTSAHCICPTAGRSFARSPTSGRRTAGSSTLVQVKKITCWGTAISKLTPLQLLKTDFTVLKRDQGHMFDTREYVRIRTGQLAKLKEGSSSAFVIHYFGSNLGKLKMTQKHPLYSLIRETCPMADKVMQEEFAKAKKT